MPVYGSGIYDLNSELVPAGGSTMTESYVTMFTFNFNWPSLAVANITYLSLGSYAEHETFQKCM